MDRGLLEIPPGNFVSADLETPLHADRRFDLVLCLEVAENLPPERADLLVDGLVGLGPAVLFSSAVPHQGGHHHVNEQWPEYWAAKFRARGYLAVDCIRSRVWEDESVAWWYAQNAILYVEPGLATTPLLKRQIEQAVDPVPALVHPRNYLEKVDPARASIRRVLRELRAWLLKGRM